jgi:molybdopterin synthase catalytic subunit
MRKDSCLLDGPITPDLIEQVVRIMNEDLLSGGHSIFLGQVRADIIDGKKVSGIEYSAYTPMVEAEAEKIRLSVMNEFKDVREIVIIHSTGQVNAGQVSLLVAVSGGHRKQAMEACNKTVELIKERLPVWKKELFGDNSHLWK